MTLTNQEAITLIIVSAIIIVGIFITGVIIGYNWAYSKDTKYQELKSKYDKTKESLDYYNNLHKKAIQSIDLMTETYKEEKEDVSSSLALIKSEVAKKNEEKRNASISKYKQEFQELKEGLKLMKGFFFIIILGVEPSEYRIYAGFLKIVDLSYSVFTKDEYDAFLDGADGYCRYEINKGEPLYDFVLNRLEKYVNKA